MIPARRQLAASSMLPYTFMRLSRFTSFIIPAMFLGTSTKENSIPDASADFHSLVIVPSPMLSMWLTSDITTAILSASFFSMVAAAALLKS